MTYRDDSTERFMNDAEYLADLSSDAADATPPACRICGDGGVVDDPGPQEGCAEFAPGFCFCPAGQAALAAWGAMARAGWRLTQNGQQNGQA